MTFVEMSHDGSLTLWDRAICTYEFAVFPPRFDLVQSKLILKDTDTRFTVAKM